MFAATAPWTIIATAHSMVLAIIQIMLNKENYNVLVQIIYAEKAKQEKLKLAMQQQKMLEHTK